MSIATYTCTVGNVFYEGRLVEHQGALCKIVDWVEGYYTLKVLNFDRNVREVLILRVPFKDFSPALTNV